MKKIILVFFTMLSLHSNAETYIQVNGISVHDRSGYNEFNYGAGVEHALNQNWNVAAGWYRNSEYRGSAYAYGRYSFYKKTQLGSRSRSRCCHRISACHGVAHGLSRNVLWLAVCCGFP